MFEKMGSFFFGVRYFFKSLLEQINVMFLFYIPHKWYRIDLSFAREYWSQTPYRHNLKMMKDKGLDKSFLFGETPPTVLANIARRIDIQSEDIIFDLGCGWGKSTFFLAQYTQAARVVGIDCSEHFISKAERIRLRLKMDSLVFIQGDFLEIDYQDAGIVYFYGSCATEEQILSLCSIWKQDLKPGALVITTSYSLDEFSDAFKLIDRFEQDYLWGMCSVFVQVKVEHTEN